MITIKKKHNINDPLLLKMINEFNNIIRYSYNRRIKNDIEKLSDIEKIVKSNMNNIESMDASWIKSAVKKATELQTDKKLYFGGKYNFFKRKYKKTDSYNKDFPLEMRGSSSDKGNRKASIIGNVFIFKPCKNIKFEIELKLSKNESKMLYIVQEEVKQCKNYFNFKINEEYIWISFNEPTIYKHEYKKNRYLGIDLNPNWIAISIMDSDKEVYKELIDLRELNKFNKDKKRYELTQINKHIINISKGFNVEYVCLEDLNIKSSNKNLGKRFNKLVNNDWNRNYLVNNLIKWLTVNDIKHLMVNPFYTSYMGQIKNTEDYDSIAASKEVAYRGFLMNNGIKVYDYVNDFLSGLVTTHWKEMLPDINTYKEMYNYFKTKKKSKNSYRFLFNDVEKLKWSSFRLKSDKSMIDLIRF
jgi:hypothetical protein